MAGWAGLGWEVGKVSEAAAARGRTFVAGWMLAGEM